jgi:hypothetical protein
LKRGSQRGQALVELVIVLPLFLALLAALAFWAQLMLARLALIQVTRDFALLLARDPVLLGASEPERSARLQALARENGGLQAEQIRQHLEALPPNLSQSSDPEASAGLRSPGLGSLLQGMLLGQRLWVFYRLRFAGLAGHLFPEGLEMKESVAFKGDAWNNPLKRLKEALAQGLDRLLGH